MKPISRAKQALFRAFSYRSGTELFFEVICIFLYDFLNFIQLVLRNTCILGKQHRTHNNVALGTNLRKDSQIKGFSKEKVKNIENVNLKGADCACWLVKML